MARSSQRSNVARSVQASLVPNSDDQQPRCIIYALGELGAITDSAPPALIPVIGPGTVIAARYNIVVDSAGRAVIVDFGLAREPNAPAAEPSAMASPGAATVTQDGAIVGTPAYMSPEQAAGHAVNPRTDVWALGLIAHELLTGTLPGFDRVRGDAPTAPEGARHGPAALVQGIATAVDRRAEGLGAIVARCLAIDPAKRFPDAIALAAALARPARARRRTLVLGGVALAVAAGAIAITVRGESGGGPRARHDGPITQAALITATAAGQPRGGAISADGRRVAYTVNARVYVRAIDGGNAVEWAGPPVTTAWAHGFLFDGTVAVLGARPDGGWGVWRVAQRAEPMLLHEESQRMQVAVSPDGTRLALGVRERGILVVDAGSREVRRLAPAARGEAISGVTWSPDGRSIAFARSGAGASEDTIEIAAVADGATRIVVRGYLGHWVDQTLVWPELDRLLYTAEVESGSTLRELDLATMVHRERLRWPGENIIAASYGGGVLLVLRGTVRFSVWTAKLDERGRPSAWARANTGDSAGRTSGWTPDGRVVYFERTAGRPTVLTQLPGQSGVPLPGAPASARPETLAGDAVIVRKLEEHGRVALARVAAGVVTELDTVAADTASNNLIRCAGDREPPCMLERVQSGRVAWTEIDPITGAAGAQLYEAPLSARFGRNAALSPDGKTLAVVDGGDAVTFVERGHLARTVPVGRGAELYSVVFAHDGRSVLVTALGHKGYVFNLIRVALDGTVDDELDNQWENWYFRASESRDGRLLAVDTQEFMLAIWRIDGI